MSVYAHTLTCVHTYTPGKQFYTPLYPVSKLLLRLSQLIFQTPGVLDCLFSFLVKIFCNFFFLL